MLTREASTHRKLVRHYDEPGHAHELTFSCYKRRSLLTDPQVCVLFAQAIDRATSRLGFELIAFVYMPEHVHLVVLPVGADAGIARLLYAIKRPFSTRVKRFWLQTNKPLVRLLTLRERPGKDVFRFWQEGGGYDRNITSADALRTAIEYVHNNPVRRGLRDSPGQWKWSSWAHYFDPDCRQDPDLPTVYGFEG